MREAQLWELGGIRRRFHLDSEFFLEGNYQRFTYFRVTSESSSLEENNSSMYCEQFVCKELNCKQCFTSLVEFEKHLFNSHRHKCSICSKCFGSDWFLSIHLSEIHDSYFRVMSKKKDSFVCIVESCPVMSSSDATRLTHLIQDHKFPSSYDFHNPSNSKQHLHKKGKKPTKKSQQEKENKPNRDGKTQPTNQPNRSTRRREKKLADEAQQQQQEAQANGVVLMAVDEDDGVIEEEGIEAIEAVECESESDDDANDANDANDTADVTMKELEQQNMDSKAADIDDLSSLMQSAAVISVPKKIQFGHKKRK